jgi:hypothetical protein
MLTVVSVLVVRDPPGPPAIIMDGWIRRLAMRTDAIGEARGGLIIGL